MISISKGSILTADGQAIGVVTEATVGTISSVQCQYCEAAGELVVIFQTIEACFVSAAEAFAELARSMQAAVDAYVAEAAEELPLTHPFSSRAFPRVEIIDMPGILRRRPWTRFHRWWGGAPPP